ETALATAGVYTGSHHNCSDVLTVTTGGRRYVVQNPDSARDYTDTSKWRRLARLTVYAGSTMTAGPIELATVSCDRGSCTSGGSGSPVCPPPLVGSCTNHTGYFCTEYAGVPPAGVEAVMSSCKGDPDDKDTWSSSGCNLP